MRSLCVVVPKSEGEFNRKKLSELGILRTDLKIHGQDDILFIPVIEEPDFDIVMGDAEFEEVELFPGYKELADVPKELKPLLPTSFDVVGDICVLKLADELLPHAAKVGEAIVKANSNIKTVVLDVGVTGELRTRNVEVIAGENRTTTTHTEYGLRFELDIASVYFSPRLAHERKRIADQVGDREIVIDMFAGVGPFSIMIARHSKADKICAIDLNPAAVEFLKQNIEKNRAENVEPYLGDADQLLSELPKASRIIMNLPHTALEFLDKALTKVMLGGTIHLYAIAETSEVDKIEKKIMDSGFGILISQIREVHTYSPTQSLFVFDIVKSGGTTHIKF